MTIKKALPLYLIITVLALLLSIPASASTTNKALTLLKAKPIAPNFILQDIYGRQHALSDYKGKVVVVNFWATWCPPCRTEVPELDALHERYGPAGLQVIGVSTDHAGAEEQVRAFVDEENVPYTILRDPENRATALFGLSGLPATFLFDSDGLLVWSSRGALQPGNADLLEALERVTETSGSLTSR